jgi:nitroreductase
MNMEIFECIISRQSVREYDKKDVPNELVGQLLEAATHAPSAGNLQPWEFIVVKDKKTKSELANAALRQRHVEEAPVVIVVCADVEKISDRYGERGKNLYCIQDTAAAIENMLLSATSLGLGTCWIGAFEEDKVKVILNIPDKLKPVALITVGFPLPYSELEKTKRIPFEHVTSSEKYGKKLEWIEEHGTEWSFKIRPLEESVKKLKEKLELTKKDKKNEQNT